MIAAGASDVRAVVIQLGARRAYELARMLESQGALAALYTDAAWPGGSQSLLRRAISTLSPGSRSALQRRTVSGIPTAKLRTSFLPTVAQAAGQLIGLDPRRVEDIASRTLGRQALGWGFAGANVLLNCYGNGGTGFLLAARAAGLKVATDIITPPRAIEILAEEQRRWPGWAPVRDLGPAIALERRHLAALIALSDLLVCPSEKILSDLSAVPGFDPKRAVYVPYGNSFMPPAAGRPMPKRVLFAGSNNPLYKGLPYLAQAASLLRATDPEVRFVVAGGIADAVRRNPLCRDVEFLGQLDPADLAAEYAKADIFCLPSVAEGSASVVLEAMSQGLPVVVTAATGSPVVNGIEGIVVPPRDPQSIAAAILAIIGNRERRSAMSEAARHTAGRHSPQVVGDQLRRALAALIKTNGRY